jgi:hypothetical protein
MTPGNLVNLHDHFSVFDIVTDRVLKQVGKGEGKAPGVDKNVG